MENVTHQALAELFNVLIAADASSWVRDLNLKSQLYSKDRCTAQEGKLPS